MIRTCLLSRNTGGKRCRVTRLRTNFGGVFTWWLSHAPFCEVGVVEVALTYIELVVRILSPPWISNNCVISPRGFANGEKSLELLTGLVLEVIKLDYEPGTQAPRRYCKCLPLLKSVMFRPCGFVLLCAVCKCFIFDSVSLRSVSTLQGHGFLIFLCFWGWLCAMFGDAVFDTI